MSRKDPTPQTIVAEQMTKYELWSMLHSGRHKYEPGHVGETILNLPLREREALSKLKSDDLKNVRVPEFPPHPVKDPTTIFRLPHEKA